MSKLQIDYGQSDPICTKMTEEDFRLFRALICEECGIDFQADKIFLLDRWVRKRMTAGRFEDYRDYYQFLKNGLEGARELRVLMDLLTINETAFFRNRPQFELLKKTVLPELIGSESRKGSKRLRIWSAGCSSGQEPYSIAMTLLETIVFPDLWDIKILASDLSLRMLELAQEGIYRRDQLRRVDLELREKYFDYADGEYRIKDRVKDLVVFDYHNLKHDNGLRGFDIVFCRNVMIYFDESDRIRLTERFARSLLQGGYVFLGHAETMKGISDRFKMIHFDKGIAYKRED